MNNIPLQILRRLYILGLGLSLAAAGWVPLYLAKKKIQEQRSVSKPLKVAEALGPQKISEAVVKMEAPTLIEKTNPLVIAIIDTGMDVDHPDLQGVLWNSNGEGETDIGGALHGWNFANSSSNIEDTNGHGTHIAGIIQKELNKYRQILPLRPIQFMILKYYNEKATGAENLKNSNLALAYAIEHGAHIINYSGGGRDSSELERALMQSALEKGIFIVAAAGNEGQNADLVPFYPASYKLPNIISVANLAKNGDLHRTSNYGQGSIDIAAPGEDIESSYPNRREATMTGTSQATAEVTAGLAAFLASRSDSTIGAEDLKERLYLTGRLQNSLVQKLASQATINSEALLTAQTAGVIAQNLIQTNVTPLADLLFDNAAELQLRLADAARVSVSN